MKLKSAELHEYCSIQPELRTMVLLDESHDLELQPDGWIKWRLKNKGQWYLTPPHIVRNVVVVEDPAPAVRKRKDT